MMASTDLPRLPLGSLVTLFMALATMGTAHADINMLNAGGYTGTGLLPNAQVMDTGKAAVSFENQLPGSASTTGFNDVVGFGVGENVEVSARLASVDLYCNALATTPSRGTSVCPANFIRDFSGSIKVKVPTSWLSWMPGRQSPSNSSDALGPWGFKIPFLNAKTTYAIGLTDFAGTARLFGGKYVVATERSQNVQYSLGYGKPTPSASSITTTPEPVLHTLFGSVQWDPTPWSRIAYDQSGRNAWLHSTVYAHLPQEKGFDVYLTLHERLTNTAMTQKSWVGLGVNIPLNDVREDKTDSFAYSYANPLDRTPAQIRAQAKALLGLDSNAGLGVGHGMGAGVEADQAQGDIDAKRPSVLDRYQRLTLPHVKKFDFQDELIKNGFAKAKLGVRAADGALVLWVDQENYPWNAMDAAGVALGVLASTFGEKSQPFVLMVGSRGLDVLSVSGDTACVKTWFETLNDTCLIRSKGSLGSSGSLGSKGSSDSMGSGTDFASGLTVHSLLNHPVDLTGVTWSFDTSRQWRPELVVSPTQINVLGSEYGAFDSDVGANLNPVLALWSGATVDVNGVVPAGIRSKNFKEGGAFYDQRIKRQIQRSLVHQVLPIPKAFAPLNTQAMVSAGKLYESFTGAALETNTLSNNGAHRLDLLGGQFQDKEAMGGPTRKRFALASYRFAMDNRLNATSEMQMGKFWGGDQGYRLTERLWYGDTALNFYIKKTRMTAQDSVVSFAGFEISIPLTPRVSQGPEFLNLRGTAQYNYSAESKILDTNNLLTGGMGVVPNVGDNLLLLSNRDRSSDAYYEARRERLRLAYTELRVQDRKSWVFD